MVSNKYKMKKIYKFYGLKLNNISKKLLSVLLLSSLGSVAMAASESVEKVQVLNVMKKYVEATSCWHSFDKKNDFKQTSIKDVFPIYSDKEVGISEYYVFWGGDKGCNGGSGTMSFFMSEVSKFSDSRPFVVQNDSAFGNDLNINFRFIEKIKQINKDQFEIISWNYADEKYGGKDGGNNFPANKFKYTVQKIMGEGWKITNQVLLEQNK